MRWDDDDDTGLESVSEPELDDLELNDESPIDNGRNGGEEEEGDETLEAVDLGNEIKRLGVEPGHATRPRGIGIDEEDEWKEAEKTVGVVEMGNTGQVNERMDGNETIKRMVRPVLRQDAREESWVKPEKDEL